MEKWQHHLFTFTTLDSVLDLVFNRTDLTYKPLQHQHQRLPYDNIDGIPRYPRSSQSQRSKPAFSETTSRSYEGSNSLLMSESPLGKSPWEELRMDPQNVRV